MCNTWTVWCQGRPQSKCHKPNIRHVNIHLNSNIYQPIWKGIFPHSQKIHPGSVWCLCLSCRTGWGSHQGSIADSLDQYNLWRCCNLSGLEIRLGILCLCIVRSHLNWCIIITDESFQIILPLDFFSHVIDRSKSVLLVAEHLTAPVPPYIPCEGK